MTRINFKRTGGVTGREVDADIDLNELPDSGAQELTRMLTETNFFKVPQNLIAHAAPDEYEYTITVESGNSHHTIHTSDSTAPESLRPLLIKLSTLVKENNSKTADA